MKGYNTSSSKYNASCIIYIQRYPHPERKHSFRKAERILPAALKTIPQKRKVVISCVTEKSGTAIINQSKANKK